MKNYLLSGLAILVPIALTIITIVFVVDVLTNPFLSLVQAPLKYLEDTFHWNIQQYHMLQEMASRILVLIFLCLVALGVGILAKIFFLKYLFRFIDHIFEKIPFIKTFFKIIREVSGQFLEPRKHLFQKTVVTAFPGTDTLAVGFITGKVPDAFRKVIGNVDLCVFIPSSPHPVSGFVLLVPEKEVKIVDISTDEAFSFIFSCGAASMSAYPEHKHVKSAPHHHQDPQA